MTIRVTHEAAEIFWVSHNFPGGGTQNRQDQTCKSDPRAFLTVDSSKRIKATTGSGIVLTHVNSVENAVKPAYGSD